jgi:hypothetical protein
MSAQLTHEGSRVTHDGSRAATTRPAVPAGAGPLRGAWHQVRRTVAEMNYAARRVVELQAPWAVDGQWHSR